jgi:hypothetical protein
MQFSLCVSECVRVYMCVCARVRACACVQPVYFLCAHACIGHGTQAHTTVLSTPHWSSVCDGLMSSTIRSVCVYTRTCICVPVHSELHFSQNHALAH